MKEKEKKETPAETTEGTTKTGATPKTEEKKCC